MTEPQATLAGVRQLNLARVLRMVHREGPVSRAVLTSATGLNRSTVADLIAELAGDGLVFEAVPAPGGRVGRPSPVVEASANVVAIAANPEVDALEIAAVGLNRQIRARERIVTRGLLSPEECADYIAERVRAWASAELAGVLCAGVGVAVPGLVRGADGFVRQAQHLQWHDAPLRDLVAAATGLPAFVGNDATLGVQAERRFGAARGVGDVIYLNGGASGIGGGVVVGGALVAGAHGYAGEFGQTRVGVTNGGAECVAGGVLEDEVNRARLMAVVGLEGVSDGALSAALADAHADPMVAREVIRQRSVLAEALANAVNVLNPSVIVLGGFLATLGQHDLPGLMELVRQRAMPAIGERLDVKVAALAADRLLIGAAEAVFDRMIDASGAVNLRLG